MVLETAVSSISQKSSIYSTVQYVLLCWDLETEGHMWGELYHGRSVVLMAGADLGHIFSYANLGI